MAFSRLFSKRSSPPSPGDPAPLWLFVHEDEGMAMSGAVVALVVGKARTLACIYV